MILAIILSRSLFLHTTLRGKFLIWRRLLDAQPWCGDEQVPDMGVAVARS